MKEVISIVKPKVFVAENVKGLSNLKNVKKIIEQDFSTADNNGYLIVETKILNAKNYGVPQSRERIIFIGFRKDALKPEALKQLSKTNIGDEYNPYPIMTHGDNLLPFIMCKDALCNLKEPNESDDLSQQCYSKAKFQINNSQGQTEIKLNDISPTIRSQHHGNIEYRRLSIEHGGTSIEELNNGLLWRRLTVRECARLQTFPDDYQFIIKSSNKGDLSLSASEAYKLIGNALPPVLAYNIAMNIEEKWSKYFK